MEFEAISVETQEHAIEQAAIYKRARKAQPDNREYEILHKAYKEIGAGRKVINIMNVLKKGGLIEGTLHPRLAVATADSKVCYFANRKHTTWSSDESLLFWSFIGLKKKPDRESWGTTIPLGSYYGYKKQVFVPYSTYPTLDSKRGYRRNVLQTSVPRIPPVHTPKGALGRYYILWEVEDWSEVPIPPGDPLLLRRLSTSMFVVLAAWDLTSMEKAILMDMALEESIKG